MTAWGVAEITWNVFAVHQRRVGHRDVSENGGLRGCQHRAGIHPTAPPRIPFSELMTRIDPTTPELSPGEDFRAR